MESNNNMITLFCNGVGPECVTVDFIEFRGLVSGCRNKYSEFHIALCCPTFWLFDDHISLAWGVIYPPCKSRFITNVPNDGKFRSFDRIRFFDIFERYTRRGTIIPFYLYIPVNASDPVVSLSLMARCSILFLLELHHHYNGSLWCLYIGYWMCCHRSFVYRSYLLLCLRHIILNFHHQNHIFSGI